MITLNQVLMTFLLNACWQIAVIVGAAVLGERLFRGTTPRHRHLLWVATLALAFALPTLTSVWLLRDSFMAPATPAAVVDAPDLELPASMAVADASLAAPFILRLGTTAALALAACYLLVVIYRALRLFLAWRRTRILAKSSYDTSLPDAVGAAVSKCYSSIDVGTVSILFSSATPGPVTIGTTKPLIILPEELLAETDESVLISAIGHEMVHVSRRDYFFNLIYELIFLPLSFHPAAMLVRRRINQTRELCCDERVAGRLLEAEEYARSLVRLAGAAANFGSPVLTTLGMGDADNLEVRVMSLLKGSVTGPNGRSYLMLTGLLIIAIVGIAVGGLGFKVGIGEVNAQQVEKQEVRRDDETEVRKLKQTIELRQKELSETTDENTARGLKAEIAKLKAELMAKTGGTFKKEIVSIGKEERSVEEYRAKLAAEEPNLTEEQVKERIGKIIMEERARVEGTAKIKAAAEPSGDTTEGRLRITKKPRPTAYGCEGSGGKTIASVVFKSDGTIGDVTLVDSSSCAVFNESVLRAIKEIEFEPQMKDGQPITVTKQIEYVWAAYSH